jgi:hypothetical protein
LTHWRWLLFVLLVVLGCSKTHDAPRNITIPPDRIPPKK